MYCFKFKRPNCKESSYFEKFHDVLTIKNAECFYFTLEQSMMQWGFEEGFVDYLNRLQITLIATVSPDTSFYHL